MKFALIALLSAASALRLTQTPTQDVLENIEKEFNRLDKLQSGFLDKKGLQTGLQYLVAESQHEFTADDREYIEKLIEEKTPGLNKRFTREDFIRYGLRVVKKELALGQVNSKEDRRSKEKRPVEKRPVEKRPVETRPVETRPVVRKEKALGQVNSKEDRPEWVDSAPENRPEWSVGVKGSGQVDLNGVTFDEFEQAL